MGFVHNNSIDKHISVYSKCIPPRGYMELSEDEIGHESIQRYIGMGLIEMVDNPKGLSPVQLIMENMEPDGHLLLQRNYALGDVLLMSALIRNIREKYPRVQIHIGTSKEAAPLLKYSPGLEIFSSIENFRECISKYGDFINMNNLAEVYEDSLRPDVSMNRIEIMCDILGIEPVHLCPEYYIKDNEIAAGYRALDGLERPLLGIAPVSKRKEKMWDLGKWELLIDLWKGAGGSVLIFHNEPLPSLIEAGAKTLHYYDIRMAAAVAYHMNCMVTLDSLWTHLSAALFIPQVLLTSCTDGVLLSKGYPDVMPIVPEHECYPCWYNFHAGGCVAGQYPECLSSIEPEMILEAINAAV